MVDIQELTPISGIQFWIDAYTNQANGMHFMGHARLVQLLREYVALRVQMDQAKAPTAPPAGEMQELPKKRTAISLCDQYGSASYAFTADEIHAYARQYAAQQAKGDAVLCEIGTSMANVMFNLAQQEGQPITRGHCAVMSDLRKRWDASCALSQTAKKGEV